MCEKAFRFDSIFCWIVLVGVSFPPLMSLSPAASAADGQAASYDEGMKKLKFKPITEEPTVVLEMIARQAEANYARIRTWSGSYSIQDKQVLKNLDGALAQSLSKASGRDLTGKHVIATLNGLCEFEVDIPNDALYSRFDAASRVFRELGSANVLAQVNREQDSLEAEDGYSVDMLTLENSIVTPEHYLHLKPDATYPRFAIRPNAGPELGRAAFRDTKHEGHALQWSTVIDPRRLFSDGMSTGWEVARRYATTWQALAGDEMPEMAKEEGWQQLKDSHPTMTIVRAETPSGPVFNVRWVLHPSPQESLTEEITFDGRVGFNMTSKQSTRGKIRRTTDWMAWTYVEKDGIFVPETVIKVNMDMETNRLAFQRNLDLKDCVVNGPLHPDGFSYQRLGLKDGERVVDRIENKVYVLDKGELEEVVAGKSFDQPIEGKEWTMTIILVLNAVVVVAVIAFVVFRRRRRKRLRMEKC